MPALPITFACGLYDRMLALHTGDVKPDGIDLNFAVLDNPREIFDRMTGRLEFDVCEMSSSEYISRFAAQKLPFVALPVFASRVFRHGFIVVNRRRVNAAKELAGKRIGVPLYTQTAAIFVRGLMQHDLGIDLTGIEWVQGAVNEAGSYGHPSLMPLLKPVKITPNTTGRSLSDLPKPARLTPLSALIYPARSAGIPTWCGYFRIFGRANTITFGARGFSRSCIWWSSAKNSMSGIRS